MAQKLIEDTIFKITNCFETEDNFIFVLYLKDGSGTNLPPIQISKNDSIEPDFYKGNFFLEELAKVGAGVKYQLFGQIGLDHGPEWYAGKITGLSTAMPTQEDMARRIKSVGAAQG